MTIGPWIEKGFGHDFDMPPLRRDLRRVEGDGQDHPAEAAAAPRGGERGGGGAPHPRGREPYKLEILEGIRERDPDAPITLYHMGGMPGTPHRWWDLCAGPHVEHTGMLPKMRSRSN